VPRLRRLSSLVDSKASECPPHCSIHYGEGTQPAFTVAGSPDRHREWFAADSLAIRGVAVASALCRLVGQGSNTTTCPPRSSGRVASTTGMSMQAVTPAALGNPARPNGTRPTSTSEPCDDTVEMLCRSRRIPSQIRGPAEVAGAQAPFNRTSGAVGQTFQTLGAAVPRTSRWQAQFKTAKTQSTYGLRGREYKSSEFQHQVRFSKSRVACMWILPQAERR
jgi:hypothetical protein